MTSANESDPQLSWTHVGIAALIAIIAGVIAYYIN